MTFGESQVGAGFVFYTTICMAIPNTMMQHKSPEWMLEAIELKLQGVPQKKFTVLKSKASQYCGSPTECLN